jgi:hypothetical protein
MRLHLTLGTATRLVAAVLLVALVTPALYAQPDQLLRSIEDLYNEFSAPDRVIDSLEAKQAIKRLESWRVEAENLPPQTQAQVTAIRTCAALAEGEAAAARRHYKSLDESFRQTRDGLELGFLVACACGDSELGAQCVKQLRRLVGRDQRRALVDKRRWLRTMGEQAPDESIRTDEMEEIPIRRRGDRLLILHFWNLVTPPTDEHLAALRALHEQYGDRRDVQFVGINADPESKIAQARTFAEEHLAWPQRYEGAAVNAPLTHEAFHAGNPPWLVLVDSAGYIRCVGTATEPGFHYALRAALVEAHGDAAPMLPGEGQEEATEEGPPGSPPSAEPQKKQQKEPEEQLKSDPDAANLLKQARVYLRLGQRQRARELLKRIVREYPGTLEAKKAREWLGDAP